MFNALHALIFAFIWLDLVGGFGYVNMLAEISEHPQCMPRWFHNRWLQLASILVWPIALPIVLAINFTHTYGAR